VEIGEVGSANTLPSNTVQERNQEEQREPAEVDPQIVVEIPTDERRKIICSAKLHSKLVPMAWSRKLVSPPIDREHEQPIDNEIGERGDKHNDGKPGQGLARIEYALHLASLARVNLC
jgi:hypothetical protein